LADKKRLVIGISGASGSALGVCALRLLHGLPDWETHLILTRSAILTIQTEIKETLDAILSLADIVYEEDNMAAAISSGSFQTAGMLVAPCSMKTVSGIAYGYSENLLLRAADVTIKERRPLVILPREAPLSTIHLKNLLILAEAGAVIFPPVPAFYQNPENLGDIVRHIVGRALSYFGIGSEGLYKPWTG